MKGLLVCMFAALFAPAFAQSSDAIQFAAESGRTTGQALACKLPIGQIQSYESAIIKQFKSFGSAGNSRSLVDAYNSEMRAAERKPAPDFLACEDIKLVLWEATQATTAATPVAATNPARPQVSSEQQAAIARKNLEYVASQGAHVCRVERGETKSVLAQGPEGPIYGKPILREFRIEGFTELVSGTRVKVLVNAIRAATQAGFEYISELQPAYTKGQYVWQESSAWTPCE